MARYPEPSEMTIDQRRREVVEILAAGVLQLLRYGSPITGDSEISPEKTADSAARRLEPSGESVLSVRSG